MNLDTLRRHARWAEKIAKAQGELAGKLAAELTQAEASSDPLGLHIYHSRASYRRASENDNKGGKKTEREVRFTFVEAQKLGYRESAEDWWNLLRVG